MKSLFALALLALPLTATPEGEGPTVGDVAPEIDAGEWFNHVGASPSLESLRGKVVLIEFWATWCKPCVAAWPHLQDLHDEFAKDGLVILGLSDEAPKKVASFVEENGYTARIASGSTTNATYGVSGIPNTVLVDVKGNIVYRGHPSGLTTATIKAALKKAKKPTDLDFLVFTPQADTDALGAAVSSIEKGKLGKALSITERLAGDDDLSADERDAASSLGMEIRAHATLVSNQAEALLAKREVGSAVDVFAALSKELAGTDLGAEAKDRLLTIQKDKALVREMDAAKAFEKTRKAAARLSTSKRKKKYQDFAEKYAGTRAAEKAETLARRPS